MIKRLVTSLIVFTFFSVFLTNSQTVFAQTKHREYSMHILFVTGYILFQPSLPKTPTMSPMPTPTRHNIQPLPHITTTQIPATTVMVTPTSMQSEPTIVPTPIPTAIPAPATTSDVTSALMDGINAYRASLGLSKVTTSTQTCDFATIRAKEITTSFSHDGFNSRLNNKTIPYTGWTRITENLATTPDSKNVVQMWIDSPEHAANMRMDTPYVCVIQNGNFYAYEGMKP